MKFRLLNDKELNLAFRLSSLTCLILIITGLASACTNLPREAEAAYGSFVTSELIGARLIQSPNISDAVKSRIKAADAKAKPVGDALFEAIMANRADPNEKDQLKHAFDVAIPAITTLAQETAK